MMTPEQRRKNAARRSRRPLSKTQIAALYEIGAHSRAQHHNALRPVVGGKRVEIRMTLSALARKGLITFDGTVAKIAPAGTAFLLRHVR